MKAIVLLQLMAITLKLFPVQSLELLGTFILEIS